MYVLNKISMLRGGFCGDDWKCEIPTAFLISPSWL